MSVTSYPAIGHVYEARFGDLAFHLDFAAGGQTMAFSAVGADGTVADARTTVHYKALEVAPKVFMVTWG